MSKNIENKLVPKIRFPEFKNEEAWSIDEVGNVFNVTRGYVLSMNLVSEMQSESNPYPVYSSQTKNNGLAGYYKDFLYEDAITWTTDGANAGDVNFRKGKFYCTNVCGVLINKDGFANLCVAALINSVSKKHVSYVGNPKLMNGVMSKINIPFPKIKEQQKIAACLSSLDEVITAESQNLELLKEHKKGLLQNLFPQEGDNVPKLRFKEFKKDGEWVVKKLGELFEFGNGKDYKHLSNGDIPVYGAGGKMLSVNDFLYEGESVCIGRKGTIDKPVFLTGKFWTVDTLFYTHSFKYCIPKFIFYIFQNIKWYDFNEAGGVPSLSKTTISKIEVAIPSESEQQRIASCLSSLDETRQAQAEKIELLKQHKKGLLQGLFPNINEQNG